MAADDGDAIKIQAFQDSWSVFLIVHDRILTRGAAQQQPAGISSAVLLVLVAFQFESASHVVLNSCVPAYRQAGAGMIALTAVFIVFYTASTNFLMSLNVSSSPISSFVNHPTSETFSSKAAGVPDTYRAS